MRLGDPLVPQRHLPDVVPHVVRHRQYAHKPHGAVVLVRNAHPVAQRHRRVLHVDEGRGRRHGAHRRRGVRVAHNLRRRVAGTLRHRYASHTQPPAERQQRVVIVAYVGVVLRPDRRETVRLVLERRRGARRVGHRAEHVGMHRLLVDRAVGIAEGRVVAVAVVSGMRQQCAERQPRLERLVVPAVVKAPPVLRLRVVHAPGVVVERVRGALARVNARQHRAAVARFPVRQRHRADHRRPRQHPDISVKTPLRTAEPELDAAPREIYAPEQQRHTVGIDAAQHAVGNVRVLEIRIEIVAPELVRVAVVDIRRSAYVSHRERVVPRQIPPEAYAAPRGKVDAAQRPPRAVLIRIYAPVAGILVRRPEHIARPVRPRHRDAVKARVCRHRVLPVARANKLVRALCRVQHPGEGPTRQRQRHNVVLAVKPPASVVRMPHVVGHALVSREISLNRREGIARLVVLVGPAHDGARGTQRRLQRPPQPRRRRRVENPRPVAVVLQHHRQRETVSLHRPHRHRQRRSTRQKGRAGHLALHRRPRLRRRRQQVRPHRRYHLLPRQPRRAPSRRSRHGRRRQSAPSPGGTQPPPQNDATALQTHNSPGALRPLLPPNIQPLSEACNNLCFKTYKKPKILNKTQKRAAC